MVGPCWSHVSQSVTWHVASAHLLVSLLSQNPVVHCSQVSRFDSHVSQKRVRQDVSASQLDLSALTRKSGSHSSQRKMPLTTQFLHCSTLQTVSMHRPVSRSKRKPVEQVVLRHSLSYRRYPLLHESHTEGPSVLQFSQFSSWQVASIHYRVSFSSQKPVAHSSHRS